jgi:hypothetical protein
VTESLALLFGCRFFEQLLVPPDGEDGVKDGTTRGAVESKRFI